MARHWLGFLAGCAAVFATGMIPLAIFTFMSGQRDPLLYATVIPAFFLVFLTLALWRHLSTRVKDAPTKTAFQDWSTGWNAATRIRSKPKG